MPAKSAGNKSPKGGGAVPMDKKDHELTASCDQKTGSKAYRDKQKILINQGKHKEAFEMDKANIKELEDKGLIKSKGKYDKQIKKLDKWYQTQGTH